MDVRREVRKANIRHLYTISQAVILPSHTCALVSLFLYTPQTNGYLPP